MSRSLRAGLVCVLVSCGGGDAVTAPTVASVSVSLAKAGIQAGESTTGTATLRDTDGAPVTGRAVTWSSASSAVATVTASGVITGATAGTSLITATADGISGSAVAIAPDGKTAFVTAGASSGILRVIRIP